MKKYLFIDRDGTLIREPADERIDSLEKLEFFPGVFRGLGRIASELDYELVMVSNQDALGTEEYPRERFDRVQEKLLRALENEGIRFADVRIDPTIPEANAPTRKPGIGMLTDFFRQGVDLASSFVIGDRRSDLEMARRLGARGIFLNDDPSELEKVRQEAPESLALATSSWDEVHRFLLRGSRKGKVHRRTGETDISVEMDLEGDAKRIDTGIPFFDHMLEQVARHGGIGLTLRAEGDLEVDAHHTIEDTALALGEAFSEALGERKGIRRYSFLLPMDESLARVALDLGGRPYLVWDVEWTSERIGDMPTEMFEHFFKSFTDAARCNLHISVSGSNEHHKAEAIFKAFARVLKDAASEDPEDPSGIPSTKGSI